MNSVMVASISPFGTAVAELTVAIAVVILLALRTWIGVSDATPSHRVTLWLTTVIIVLVAVFLVLVGYRFKTIG